MKITLKAIEPTDIPILLKWENDPSVWSLSRTIEPFSKFKLEVYIEQTLNFDVFGLRQLRLMIHKSEDSTPDISVPVGTIEMFDFDPVNQNAGIGIMLAGEHCGQGIGKQVLDQFLPYLFDKLHIHSVYANISETNTASIKFFEAYGFTKVAEYKEFLFENERFVSQLTYQYIKPS